MAKETEHKFLVDADSWRKVTPMNSSHVVQGYIARANGVTVRVRTKDEKGFLTIKGPSVGASRDEFEYQIPKQDAENMLQLFCPVQIRKIRHEVVFAGNTWEVDVFEGANAGLIVAEIELPDESWAYEKPGWITSDVTQDRRYSNASLADRPYTSW
jgi:CYTH domain-containing protein